MLEMPTVKRPYNKRRNSRTKLTLAYKAAPPPPGVSIYPHPLDTVLGYEILAAPSFKEPLTELPKRQEIAQ